jgi:hypothetical protein
VGGKEGMKERKGGVPTEMHLHYFIFHAVLSSVNQIKSWYDLMKNVSSSEGLLMQIQN